MTLFSISGRTRMHDDVLHLAARMRGWLRARWLAPSQMMAAIAGPIAGRERGGLDAQPAAAGERLLRLKPPAKKYGRLIPVRGSRSRYRVIPSLYDMCGAL